MRTYTTDEYPESYGATWRDRLPTPLAALWGSHWLKLAVAVGVGILFAEQLNAPSSRVIKALAGVLLFALAYRTQPFNALCFIGLMFLFPFTIFVGTSTMIFIVLAALIYIARLTLGQVPPLRRSPADLGVGLMMAAYLLSFYNVSDPNVLRGAVFNMFGITASFMLYFMTANFIRTEAQLRTFVRVLGIAIALAIFVGMYELAFPGRVLIPHWILYSGKATGWGGEGGYRVGGPLYDYELFGELMAISFFLAVFLFRRAETARGRFLYGLLSVMCVFTLLTTVTRGATLAFLGGLVYFTWAIRREIKPRNLILVLGAAAVLYVGLDFVVAHYTRSGSIADRLFDTKFEDGLPDSRQHWPQVVDRALEHPWVGHGPYYDLGLSRGFTGKALYMYAWPHCQYLYFLHTIGLFGVSVFLFIAYRAFRISFHYKAPTLRDRSYARSLMVVLNVMFLVFLVDQIKIEYQRSPTYEYFPWLLIGLIMATWHVIRDEERRTSAAAAPAGGRD